MNFIEQCGQQPATHQSMQPKPAECMKCRPAASGYVGAVLKGYTDGEALEAHEATTNALFRGEIERHLAAYGNALEIGIVVRDITMFEASNARLECGPENHWWYVHHVHNPCPIMSISKPTDPMSDSHLVQNSIYFVCCYQTQYEIPGQKSHLNFAQSSLARDLPRPKPRISILARAASAPA